VKPSAALAYMWFDLAARRGVAGAAKARDALGRTMKPFALKLAKAFAARWKPKRVRKDFRLRGGGTGVFVNFSHWVVTNEHVIKRCSLLAVQHDGRIWDRVKVIAARRDIDLALLEVEVPDGRSFTHGIAAIAPPDRAPLGEQVAVFGYPWSGILSSQGVFTVGILNAHVGARNNRNYIQISAPIQPGNSGSAVYDETGQVMGIVASSLRPIKNTMPQIVNFAVKGSVMREMIDAFHTPNYSFDAKTAPTLTVKQRAKVAQRNAAHVLCYGH
jgi:S1-C subfamily serine protease